MKKVLLVEDDPFLSDIYITKLKQSGFAVDLAIDGKDALRKLRRGLPDLLLLDIVLPKLDGWSVLDKIRKEGGLGNMKVVILSNLGQREDVRKGEKFGISGYLIKARHTPSEVIEEIKKLLR